MSKLMWAGGDMDLYELDQLDHAAKFNQENLWKWTKALEEINAMGMRLLARPVSIGELYNSKDWPDTKEPFYITESNNDLSMGLGVDMILVQLKFNSICVVNGYDKNKPYPILCLLEQTHEERFKNK